MEGLNIYSMNSTNEDIIITYTPSLGTYNYSYTIIKDGVNEKRQLINNNLSTNIILKDSGIYKIEIIELDAMGNKNVVSSGKYIIDKVSPTITLKEKTYKITTKDEFEYMSIVSAKDNYDGDITQNVTTNISSLDLTTPGIKELKYSVLDSAGNSSNEILYLTVVKDNTTFIRISQLSIALIVVMIFILLHKYIKSIKYEKRFSKYTINSSKNKAISLFDNLFNLYTKIIGKISKMASKSEFIVSLSKKYDKYIKPLNLDNSINIVSKKFLTGILFILIAGIVKLIQSEILKMYEIILPFILGFYTLDIIYIIKYHNYKNKIKHDFIEAISVMNNAFKSGRSIVQAVELVSKELNGPIAHEFNKIYLELLLGLDVEVAFKRFSDRINLEEAVYLTSSLSILNKTGGNIIKVFDSIEKTLFSRKKLNEELKALTSSSKLVMIVLIIVPIMFVVFIALINKEYFLPLFTNVIGIVLIVIMLVIYITYILVVRKVMEVRM